MCPENAIWPETPANTTALYACPLGESGFITRYCSIDGIWLAANYSACRKRKVLSSFCRTNLLSSGGRVGNYTRGSYNTGSLSHGTVWTVFPYL